jgi:hypothetical protein
MRTPFDSTRPIQLLFDQIETAVKFADTGNRPYNPDQVVSQAYLLILQTGLYSDACCDWRRPAFLTQTWPNFKANFSEAHHGLRIVQTAAHGASYQSANAGLGRPQSRPSRRDHRSLIPACNRHYCQSHCRCQPHPSQHLSFYSTWNSQHQH